MLILDELSVKIARLVAEAVHSGQKYDVRDDYIVHLDEVDGVLVEFGFKHDYELRVAGYFHDAVEDQKLKLGYIGVNFGKRPMEIVYSVTDELGANRKERKQKTLPKTAKDKKGVILKLADRIANARRKGTGSMYADEQALFESYLYTPGENEEMWKELRNVLKSKVKSGDA